MDLDLPNLGQPTAAEAVFDEASKQILLVNSNVVQTYSMALNSFSTPQILISEKNINNNSVPKKSENTK